MAGAVLVKGVAWLVGVTCLWLPAPAVGQPVEERPSADSPAGTEYAIPLERAREQAGGGPSGDPAEGVGRTRSGLFGVGVGAPRAERPAGGPGAPGGQAGGPGPGDPGGSGRARSPAAAAPPPLAGDSGVSVTVGALVLAVLLLGGGVGLLARRAGTS